MRVGNADTTRLYENLIQSWARVNDGHYDYLSTQGEMDRAFHRAATLLLPMQPLDPAAMQKTLAGISAMNLARTPIADSLAKIESDLAGAKGTRVVVLVTDGEETCDGDPEAVLQQLSALGIGRQLVGPAERRRRTMKISRQILLGLLAWSLVALPVASDTKVVMEEGTGIVGDGSELPENMRQTLANQEPATTVYWLAKDRAAYLGKSGRMISRLDRGESYFVNDQSKTYLVIDLEDRDDSAVTQGTAELVKTGETRKIDSWDTVRYEMSLDLQGDEPADITLWVASEVGVDLAAYRALIAATAAQTGFEWMSRYLEVGGFPVRQEYKMGPIQSWQQVVAISEEAAPNGTYDPPAGYTRSD
jgi:hypothetical protein